MLWSYRLSNQAVFRVYSDGTVRLETTVNDVTQIVMLERAEWLAFLAEYHHVTFPKEI